MSNLEKVIKSLIDTKSEGDYWDFKQEWHNDSEKLLHDIICFANTAHDKDCYIIIGVADNGEIVGVDQDKRMKQVSILDMLSNTFFAGDNVPEIEVNTLCLEEKEVDVLTVFNSYAVPYYLKKRNKKHNKIRDGHIYIRVGDKNTQIDQNASMSQIEMLWKKRLGLTLPPLQQIANRLSNKLEWTEHGETFYNIYRPEFKIVERYDEEKYGHLSAPFYVYTQTNSQFSYKDLKIMYNETVLDNFQLVVLDSGRYVTPVPSKGSLNYDFWEKDEPRLYRYYTKDSIRYKVQQFLFDYQDDEQVYAKRDFDSVVLYYENEEERAAFERFVDNTQPILDSHLDKSRNNHFTVDSNNEPSNRIDEEKLSLGLALNKMLDFYRSNL